MKRLALPVFVLAVILIAVALPAPAQERPTYAELEADLERYRKIEALRLVQQGEYEVAIAGLEQQVRELANDVNVAKAEVAVWKAKAESTMAERDGARRGRTLTGIVAILCGGIMIGDRLIE